MTNTGLRSLKAVLAVARHGSFRVAARELEMSTSALSHAVGRLESDLGVRLFNRTTRSVSLTDAGREFVEAITPALSEIGAALESARSQRETPAGVLRINASVQGGRALAPLVVEFLGRYPEMQVDVVTEGRLVDIVAEGFDLGLRSADLVPRDMIALPIGVPQRHAVVASPEWLTHNATPRSPADLPVDACIRVRLPDGALYRWQFEKNGDVVLIDARGRLTIDEPAIARSAVLAGTGIGYFIEQDVAADLAEGRLIRLLEDWTPQRPGFSLYYPGRRNPSAGFSAFLDLVRRGNR
ncbi:LysR substrate-binding domain-containing protein [Pelagovum pacificum]|uniref:LysR family transcriptional regulator n=2 Tax=Pelagovum pacificum TaxID=2588711 RepID=A0A5C5GHZ1_9RHOB|nr:LysR substrate-binding domain-containing protein [Pelagovum pacificum]QQA45051.1 LysR family transcriptional regulator [Pelagovum pacificum]TNY34405.1 LysR family transcriptional regulator [Pelagovum pacificum]